MDEETLFNNFMNNTTKEYNLLTINKTIILLKLIDKYWMIY
jgi:hypothetical protein